MVLTQISQTCAADFAEPQHETALPGTFHLSHTSVIPDLKWFYIMGRQALVNNQLQYYWLKGKQYISCSW